MDYDNIDYSKYYNRPININLGFNMNNIIEIPQYSTGNSFNFYVENYTIPLDADVNIYVKKPSGYEVLIGCPFQNNIIVAPCTVQMLAELGDANSQIQIFENGEYLCSFKFTIRVVENIYAAMKIESANEYRKLEDLMMLASYVITQVNEQEAGRVEEEKIRVANENERIENEEKRKSNETKRDTEEGKRIDNEKKRVSAEDIRKANETTRQENENRRIAKENERISNETSRNTTFSGWSQAIAGYINFEQRISHLENPAKTYVPLNSNEIVRGTYDQATDSYTRGCKMEYDPTIEGLVISFI